MVWLRVGEIIGAVLTVVILYFLIKEIKKSIKDSNSGKISDKCELD